MKLVETSMDDDKAQDVVVVDLAGKSDIADYLVIASGTSKSHVRAIAEHIGEKIKKISNYGVSVEGLSQCDWVLVDAGDVIIHVFRPEIREFYCLEKMWDVPASERTA